MNHAAPLRAATAAAAATLLLAGCAGDTAPQDYREFTQGPVSVMLPPQLVVPEGGGEVPAGYDIYLQDSSDPSAQDLGMALMGMTEFRGATSATTTEYDAVSALEYMTVLDPMGHAHPTLPEPQDVSHDGDTVLRQDVPRGEGDDVYHIWAAQDGDDGTVSVLVLGGRAVTEEMVSTIDETFTVDGSDR